MPTLLRPEDLTDLLPVPVVAVLSQRAPEDDHALLAAEWTATALMRPTRRREFAHGRDCARTALGSLGLADQPIPVGPGREPVWPAGIVGSITHCGMVAAAAVARRSELAGIGLDIETAAPLDDEARSMVCAPEELRWLTGHADAAVKAKLIFSAKESIYKCIWPSLRRFVDFRDVSLQVSPRTGTFRAAPRDRELPAGLFERMEGRFRLTGGVILTAAWLPGKD